MFGYFKWRRSVNRAGEYCQTMFAGIGRFEGKSLPAQVIGDAYVLGFLQQLIVFAIHEEYGGNPGPAKLISASRAAFNLLAPTQGDQLMAALQAVNSPSHFGHVNYSVGRREGGEYLAALMAGDIDTQADRMTSFRDFVRRNYLH